MKEQKVVNLETQDQENYRSNSNLFKQTYEHKLNTKEDNFNLMKG